MKNIQSLHQRELESAEYGHNLRRASMPGASPRKMGREVGSRFNLNAPKPVHISLEELKSFETLENQFQNLGVKFSNAIVLSPSNPAFAVTNGVKVLMGAPKSGLIEVTFTNPVKWVSAKVTSSRRTILSAYDRQGTEIARNEMPTPNLFGSDSPIPPNILLKVQGDAISKATFYAFDGQLTVVDFSFGF